MQKTTRRKLLFSLLAVLLLPIVFVVAALNNASVQSFLAHRLAGYVSEKWHTTVSVEDLDFGLFSHLRLHGLLIRDQQDDTLIYVKTLKIGITDLNFSEQRFQLNHVILEHPYFNLQEDDTTTNLQFLLNQFASTDTSSTTTSPQIWVRHITIQNGRFTYCLDTHHEKTSAIDWNDMAIQNFSISLENVKNEGDNISAQIEHLSLQEKSRFRITNLRGRFMMDSSQIGMKDFKITTTYSAISGHRLQLAFSAWSDFSDFLEKVDLYGDFNWSALGFRDLSKFAAPLESMHQRFLFQGIVKGTVSDLRTKNFSINWGNASQATFSGSISGLPDLNETFVNVKVRNLKTDKYDLEQLLPDSTTLPDMLTNLNTIHFVGELTGFYTDLVAYGTFRTNLGAVKTDLSLKQDSTGTRFYYEGMCASQSFDVGKVLKQSPLLGRVTMHLSVKGEYWENHNSITLNGFIDSVLFNRHNYKQIAIDGMLENKMFDGELKINDPMLQLDFLGMLDFSEKRKKFDFTADVKRVVPKALHFLTDTTLTEMQFLLKSNIVSNQKNDYNGSLELYQTKLHFTDTTYAIKQFYATLKNDHNRSKLDVESDMLDLQARWNMPANRLLDYMLMRIRPYYSYLPKSETTDFVDSSYLTLQLATTDNALLNHFLDSTIVFGDTAHLSLTDTLKSQRFAFRFTADSVAIAQNILHHPMVTMAQKTEGKMQVRIETPSLENNIVMMHQWQADLLCFRDTVETSVVWDETDSTMGSNVQALLHFESQTLYLPKILIDVVPSYISMGDKIWYLNDAQIAIDTQKLRLNQFIVNHDDEYIYANGAVSSRKEDTVHFMINNIDVHDFNDLIASYKINGLANGRIDFSTDSNTFLFDSHIDVNRFSVDDELLGDLTLKSQWHSSDKALQVDFYTKRGKLTPIKLVGTYNLSDQHLHFNMDLSKVVLKKYAFLTNGILSHLRGLLNGHVSIEGTLDKPLLNGALHFEKTSFTVDYLQTSYNFAGTVQVTPTALKINRLLINDNVSGKQAVLSGELVHNYLQDLQFDFKLKTDNFLFLHTRERDNDLFFGDVYAGGVVSITGTPRLMTINAMVKTMPKTNFNLQLNSAEEAASYNFVNFVSPDKKSFLKKKTTVVTRDESTNVSFLFDVAVTPDASVQLIFDSKVGDIIKANGHGDLEMKYDQSGTFSMSGDLSIDRGDYLFTLQDIVNKKFDIEKGSTIKWNGDPMKAYIDLTAIYRLNASLYELTLDSLDHQRVPVACNLHMSNQLLNPKIDFGIEVKSQSSTATSILEAMSQDEINKQLITLLVLNRFYTPENMLAGGRHADVGQPGAIGVTGSEMLSNQLSNWLSQMSDKLDIDVRYRPGSNISRDEVEVALSTQLFNDKVTINSNVNMGGNRYVSSAVQSNNANAIAGDVSIEYKLNPSGTLRTKVFNKSNDNVLLYQNAPYSQGIGIFYTESFSSWKELKQKYSRFLKAQKERIVKKWKTEPW